MFFGQNRNQLRQMYIDAWQKFQKREKLTQLEELIAGVIKMHPEYHGLLTKTEVAVDADFLPEMGETNPFLHMGMHIALHEQISTDRPAGIRDVARQLLQKHKDAHEVEHLMMEHLAEAMWRSQQDNTLPDEQAYLRDLQELARK